MLFRSASVAAAELEVAASADAAASVGAAAEVACVAASEGRDVVAVVVTLGSDLVCYPRPAMPRGTSGGRVAADNLEGDAKISSGCR